ncbi:restriction endonuclease subunit S [Prodigiosinella confusarubida]|uniref:Restriction endonuclease subunit S n=1 Tax=Serratia sp. (strain ATCC 39006) TaxID=104623 RepID=A0A2I5T1D0_SERS3|nr:restriction endonuclease subunit S [Serratia sp. ATCC 39006]AUG98363.1 restriction endonuclease subunit S [Serratia sp. ATCC 39006]AUH02678.1 restriction endonuclease subunit S [Serratia sp. ATCC 39006]
MGFDWGVKKLGDILTLQRGHDLPSQDRKFGKVPIMGSSGVTGYHDQYKAKGPGVIIGRSGNSMGQVSYVSENYWPLNTSLYVTDFKGNCPEFIYYFLKQINFDQFNSGSAQKSLNRNAVYPFEVKFPSSYKTQSAIASILFALEDKIGVNQEINQTFEQMAQALFKSWFVDFEPVKSKMMALEAGGSHKEATLAAMTAISGKDSDSLAFFERELPEKYAQLKSTAELFPAAMQHSELGEIPEGWNIGPLSDIAIFTKGKIEVSKLTTDTYISTENMLENKMGISQASSLPSASTVPNFSAGHILISNIRPYFKKIWLARFSGGRSADVLAFESKKNITVEFLYNLLYQDVFFDFMMLTSKGVKMPRGDKTAIMGWSCIQPEEKLLKAFSKSVRQFYSYIESHNSENKYLTELRDTLLPKLLSGEITLPEAEQAVSEAENV